MKTNWKLTTEQKDQIVERYKAGENMNVLAKAFGVWQNAIFTLLQRRGVQRRPLTETSRRHHFDLNFFEKIDTEHKAYFLGLLDADGCNDMQKGRVALSLHKKDEDILHKFKTAIGHTGELYYVNNQAVFTFCGQKVCSDLAALGCVPNKTFHLTFPNIPSDLIRHYVRGYFDGDGGIVWNGKVGAISIISTKQYCTVLADLLWEHLQIKTTPRPADKARCSHEIQRVYFGGNNQVLRFLDWLYTDSAVSLNRKHQLYLKIKHARLSISESKNQKS